MCRFLIVRTSSPLDPRGLMSEFAEMARLSRAPDGDRQADGWGAAWQAPGLPTLSSELPCSGWKTMKSLRPIWEDGPALAAFPETRLFAVHARSASFPHQKNDIEFNQPFVAGSRAFVYNGMIKGISFPRPLEGRIGAQKIWSLLKPESGGGPVGEVLAAGVREIEVHAREIQALNIGLIDEDRIAVYSHPAGGVAYYGLWIAETADMTAVCSEPLASLPFRPLPSGSVVAF